MSQSAHPTPAFEKLLILDFEATCNSDKSFPRNQMEIIEFPTLVYDIQSQIVQDVFHEYARPTINPKLTQFCTELTGITQSQVEEAAPFPEVWSRYIAFLESHGVFSSPPKFCFLTCGDWDIKTMLPLELARHKGLDARTSNGIFNSWINVKRSFQAIFEAPGRLGMVDMLEHAGLALEGRHHSGIDDCKNISRIVQKLQENGWDAASSLYSTQNVHSPKSVIKRNHRGALQASSK